MTDSGYQGLARKGEGEAATAERELEAGNHRLYVFTRIERLAKLQCLGIQHGGYDITSVSGFSAVEIITAKGNNTSTISGDSTAQHTTDRRSLRFTLPPAANVDTPP